MTGMHRLLVRQVRRHLPTAHPQEIQVLRPFLEAVSAAYDASDTDRALLERALELCSTEISETNGQIQSIFLALPDEILLLDGTERLLEYKRAAVGASLVRAEAPVEKQLEDLVDADSVKVVRTALALAQAQKAAACCELLDAPVGPDIFRCFEVRAFCLHDGRMVAMLRDISERKLAEQRIARLAYEDGLTGLPNRALFQERLRQVVEQARATGERFALLFLDVDRFKSVNDTFGHDQGDSLLVIVAERLRCAVRASDLFIGPVEADGPLLARLGGDEFTIILHQVQDERAVAAVCSRILQVMAEPITLQGIEVVSSVSVGVALYPEHGDNADCLVRHADAAMYQAKQSGRNNHQLYSPSSSILETRLALEADLRRALAQDQLFLVYQPVVSSTSGRIVAMEGLLRWRHPARGFVSPAEFIPLAEDSDLILEIGNLVLQKACAQLAAWRAQGLRPPALSLNLSSRHFWRGDVVGDLLKAMHLHDIGAELLAVELTETALLQNTDRCVQALQKLRELGIRLYLDDFGTGYASLAYLKRFPFNVLKVDRAFVRDVPGDAESASLVKAIIAMGHSLGLQVVAEGVETREQLQFLQAQACDLIQGYLISRPQEPGALERYFERPGQERIGAQDGKPPESLWSPF